MTPLMTQRPGKSVFQGFIFLLQNGLAFYRDAFASFQGIVVMEAFLLTVLHTLMQDAWVVVGVVCNFLPGSYHSLSRFRCFIHCYLHGRYLRYFNVLLTFLLKSVGLHWIVYILLFIRLLDASEAPLLKCDRLLNFSLLPIKDVRFTLCHMLPSAVPHL